MKIAIIADPLDNQSAGVHQYTTFLVDSLIRNRGSHEILVIREKEDPKLQGCQQIAVSNIRQPIGYASIRLFVIIPAILRRQKVDVVIEPAHFGPFNLPHSIVRVTMIHDLTPILFPQWHRWHSQWLQRTFLPRILRWTDLILSNSKNTTRDIHEVYPFTQGKVHTLLLGSDPFYRPARGKTHLDDLGIRPPYFHFLGTIEPRKGLASLLAAFQVFKKFDKDKTQLVITGGSGWKNEDIFETIKNHPNYHDIILTGYLDKRVVMELHTYSQALIYPSHYEGFGLPVLEAMSCGCHVITCRNSSLTEVGGTLAHYFETGNAEDLLRSMKRIADKTPSSIQKNDLINWAKGFSWDTYATKLLSILKRAFDAKKE